MADGVTKSGRARVIVALFALVLIVFALVAGLSLQPHSQATGYAEGRGLASALIGALLLVGVNREIHRAKDRAVTWRTRFAAAWVGAMLGVAFNSPLMGSVPAVPPEFDFSDVVAMQKERLAAMGTPVTEPRMYFNSAFGAGTIMVALVVQLGAFLIPAAKRPPQDFRDAKEADETIT